MTFVDEPWMLGTHLAELARVASLSPRAVLPSHGDPDRIAAGGYPAGLLEATAQDLRVLAAHRDQGGPPPDLHRAIAPAIEAGWIAFHAPYAAVHEENLQVIATAARAG